MEALKHPAKLQSEAPAETTECIKDIQKGIFARSLGKELADSFIDGLYSRICALAGVGDEASLTRKDISDEGARIFYSLAKDTYGPIACHYVDWLLASHKMSGIGGKMLFLARDATFLFRIAEEIRNCKQEEFSEVELGLLYYNRKIAGIADEIEGTQGGRADDSMVKEYLQQEGIQGALLVDIGMYGTLYNIGKRRHFGDQAPSIAFFFSKNPSITGFLNLAGNGAQPGWKGDLPGLAGLIADCFESLNPQEFKSPSELVNDNGRIRPRLEKVEDEAVQKWAQASLAGYAEAARQYCGQRRTGLLHELQKLDGMAKESKISWNGLIPFGTPEWSMKEHFLRNVYDAGSASGLLRTHASIKMV